MVRYLTWLKVMVSLRLVAMVIINNNNYVINVVMEFIYYILVVQYKTYLVVSATCKITYYVQISRRNNMKTRSKSNFTQAS